MDSRRLVNSPLFASFQITSAALLNECHSGWWRIIFELPQVLVPRFRVFGPPLVMTRIHQLVGQLLPRGLLRLRRGVFFAEAQIEGRGVPGSDMSSTLSE